MGEHWPPHRLVRFVTESNAIEGIFREPTKAELDVSAGVLGLEMVTVEALEGFVSICAPGAKLRTRKGMDVRVGQHLPPRGGKEIRPALVSILARVRAAAVTPYRAHVEYETLHPFMDGNGRSGRILWAWQMVRRGWDPEQGLSFLHAWYYQSLDASHFRALGS